MAVVKVVLGFLLKYTDDSLEDKKEMYVMSAYTASTEVANKVELIQFFFILV